MMRLVSRPAEFQDQKGSACFTWSFFCAAVLPQRTASRFHSRWFHVSITTSVVARPTPPRMWLSRIAVGGSPQIRSRKKIQAPDGVIASSNEIKYANDLGTSNNEVNQIDHSHTRRVSCLRSPLSWLVILGDQGLWASTHSYARRPHSWRQDLPGLPPWANDADSLLRSQTTYWLVS